MSDQNLVYRVIPPCSPEQNKLLPLLGRCFPDHWGKRPPGSPFSYAGTSFVAENASGFIAHAAIMKIEIDDGNGNAALMGGLASVAVDPDFRGRGIAEKLCRMAQKYFGEHGFALLSLYTALYRVYEKSGWRRYDNAHQPWTLVSSSADLPKTTGITAPELSASQRELVIRANMGGVSFPGKTRRYEGEKVSHSWTRMFARSNAVFYLSPNGYAIRRGGVLEELFAPEDELPQLLNAALADNQSALTVAVPPACLSMWMAEKWGFAALSGAAEDPMHGESPMIYTVDDGRCPALEAAIREHRFFFPSIDKF